MMKRLPQHLVGVTALAALGVVAATGCAENDSSLFVQGVMVVEPPDCTVRFDGNQPLLGSGFLDLAFSSQYQGMLLVGNQMATRGNKNQLRAETSRVRLDGAIVRVEDDLGNELLEFSLPGSGFVNVNTGTAPAYGGILATLIPASISSQYIDQLSAADAVGSTVLLIANVRAYGETLGGQEIESADLNFPIQLCYGCSVFYPAEAIGSVTAGQALECSEGSAEFEGCFAGQSAIDCRACNDLAICRNVPTR